MPLTSTSMSRVFHLLFYNWVIFLNITLKHITADVVLWTESSSKGGPLHQNMELNENLYVQNPGPLPLPSSLHNPGQEWWSPDYSPPFPSHPTWGPGIPIAWSPALVHTLPLCIHTPHCLKEENTPKKTPIQYMLNVSLIGHLQCNVMYFEHHHGCVIV